MDWGAGESVIFFSKHPQRLTSRYPGLLRGARVSMISVPTLLNSILGMHSQGIERTKQA